MGRFTRVGNRSPLLVEALWSGRRRTVLADARVNARGMLTAARGCGLKVRFAPAWLTFLPFVWGDYWIIGRSEDYSWAVVGSPDREYLWILARTPHLDEDRAAAARGVARANGFDVERLIHAHGTSTAPKRLNAQEKNAKAANATPRNPSTAL